VTSGDFQASWERVRGHLARAWIELPPGESPPNYQEFLDHNELELAMETLAECGEDRSAPRAFWSALADAANEMQMLNQARTYRERSAL
jgi:hypothetical protein